MAFPFDVTSCPRRRACLMGFVGLCFVCHSSRVVLPAAAACCSLRMGNVRLDWLMGGGGSPQGCPPPTMYAMFTSVHTTGSTLISGGVKDCFQPLPPPPHTPTPTHAHPACPAPVYTGPLRRRSGEEYRRVLGISQNLFRGVTKSPPPHTHSPG